MQNYIKGLLGSMAVSAKYRGYPITVVACELLLEDEMLLYAVNKELYPKVAQRCKCSGTTIERNIRTVIMHIWDRNRQKLFEIAGYEMDAPPPVTEFLGILISHLQRSETVMKK